MSTKIVQVPCTPKQGGVFTIHIQRCNRLHSAHMQRHIWHTEDKAFENVSDVRALYLEEEKEKKRCEIKQAVPK